MKKMDDAIFENVNFNLRYYLQVLYRRKWFIFVIFFLFVTGGVLFTARQQKTYIASAILSITPPRKRSVGNIEIQEQVHIQMQYFVNTQKQILQGEGTVSTVIEQLDEKVCLQFFNRPKDKLRIKDVQKVVNISHVRNTHIFKVNVIGPHPDLCADIANLIVSIYIDNYNRGEKSSQNKLLVWLNEEVPERRGNLEKAEEKLRMFEKKHKNILFLARQETDFDATVVNTLVMTIQETNIQLLTKKSNYDKCALARKKKTLEAILRLDFFQESSLLHNLRQREFELQQEYQENRLRYQPGHQKMVWLKKSLENIKRKIKQEALLFVHHEEQKYLQLVHKKQELESMLSKEKSKVLKERQIYIDYQHAQRDHAFQTKAYESFIAKMEEIESTSNYEINNVRQIHQAIPADKNSPYRPRVLLNYLISAFLGVFTGIILVVILENLDETIQNEKDIAEMIDTPVFGKIPFISKRLYGKNIERVVSNYNKSPITEAFRATILNLLLLENDQKTFAITSPWAGDGKTIMAANIAQTIAKSGKKVLLIDSDLYKPRIQSSFDLANDPGFADLLQDKISAEDVTIKIQENLWCISAGELPKDPHNTLYNSPIKTIIKDFETKYDYIIFDTPPIGLISDVLLLEKNGVKMFLVVATFKSSKKMLAEIFKRLEILQISLQGIILNSKTKGSSNMDKQYYYYYGK